MKSRDNFVQDASLKLFLVMMNSDCPGNAEDLQELAVKYAHNLWEVNQRYNNAILKKENENDT